MGYGSWNAETYACYTTIAGRTLKGDGTIETMSVQDAFKQRHLDKALNPFDVIRECRDSGEHPNTIPVILGVDVTGSMGAAARKVVEQLNPIIQTLYDTIEDVQVMTMGIGDFSYDTAPLQVSQFESDIRIAEQLDKIYFEAGGGGNSYESYTGAWYFGVYRTSLDCLKRGKKGIIITLGDECLNPYLPFEDVKEALGGQIDENDLKTDSLIKVANEKFNIYHFSVDNYDTAYGRRGKDYQAMVDISWKNALGQNYRIVNIDSLKDEIINVIKDCSINSTSSTPSPFLNGDNTITW